MVHENSLKNLEKGIPTRFQAGEQQAIIAKKGGEARQRKRRERQQLNENVAAMLASRPRLTPDLKKLYTRLGLLTAGLDLQGMILAGLASRAIKGDSKCAKLLFDLLGETADAQLQQVKLIQERQKIGIDELGGKGSEVYQMRRSLDEMTDEELAAYEQFCEVFGQGQEPEQEGQTGGEDE